MFECHLVVFIESPDDETCGVLHGVGEGREPVGTLGEWERQEEREDREDPEDQSTGVPVQVDSGHSRDENPQGDMNRVHTEEHGTVGDVTDLRRVHQSNQRQTCQQTVS